ncbi:MAG: pH regulation protein F [Spirochaetales bacterium]|nr:pH regulation protein F [Spirochaetales bacterium]
MDVRLVLDLAVYALLATTALSAVRVVIGPTPEDRLIGLNLAASQVLAILVVLGVREEQAIYLDVALVYAILGYIGILAIARHLGKGAGS